MTLVQAEQRIDTIMNDQIARGVRDERTLGVLSNSDSAILMHEASEVESLLTQQLRVCSGIDIEAKKEIREERALIEFSRSRQGKKIKGGSPRHGGYGLGR